MKTVKDLVNAGMGLQSAGIILTTTTSLPEKLISLGAILVAAGLFRLVINAVEGIMKIEL